MAGVSSSGEELVTFVTARLDEDEATASAGARRVGMPWRAEPQPGTPGGLVTDELGLVGSTGGRYAAEHIARHDPARVLREVEAKRARLALYLDAKEALAAALGAAPPDGPAFAHSYVRERINVNQASGRFAALEMSVRLDAMAWCDHPDYDPEWKP
jgi:hypothetical protein